MLSSAAAQKKLAATFVRAVGLYDPLGSNSFLLHPPLMKQNGGFSKAAKCPVNGTEIAINVGNNVVRLFLFLRNYLGFAQEFVGDATNYISGFFLRIFVDQIVHRQRIVLDAVGKAIHFFRIFDP